MSVSFLITRLVPAAICAVGVTIVAFGLIRLVPGDPVEVLSGERLLSPEQRQLMLHNLGLDRSLPVQYLHYVGDLLGGDFGRSIISRDSVLSEFLARFPATLELSLSAMALAALIGIPAGIFAALWRGSWPDHAITSVSLVGYAMPIFWWAILLILLFSVSLGLTPVGSRIGVEYFVEPVTGFLLVDTLLAGDVDAFLSAGHHLLLPAITLSTIPMAVLARMTRSAMLEVLQEDYVRAARAKGAGRFRAIAIHALRNALVPVVTVFGLQVSTLVGGAVLTETIFAWPGVGNWIVQSVWRRDYPVLQGGLVLISAAVILTNLGVDVFTALINPRLRQPR